MQGESATDELRALRARAYGPDADIADDPVALRRLHELEEQARPETTDAAARELAADTDRAGEVAHGGGPPAREAPGHYGEARGEPAPAAESTGTEPRTAAATDAVGGEPASKPAASGLNALHQNPARASGEAAQAPAEPSGPSTPAGKPWWRQTRTLWIASVVVAALIGSAVTLAVSPLAAGRVAVLQVDPDAERPDNFFSSSGEGVVFEEFFGLTALLTPEVWNGGETLDCVFIRPSVDDAGPSTGGCAGNGFPPTAALVVSDSFPDELRERFVDGTALQFVVEGSQLHVYAKPPLGGVTP